MYKFKFLKGYVSCLRVDYEINNYSFNLVSIYYIVLILSS